jgi:hypothetical protein
MQERNYIGVLGGRSEIGKYCVAELLKSTNCNIIIATRNIPDTNELNSRRISYMQINIFTAEQLDAFCNKSSIVINCAGPSTVILDTVANSCLKNNAHYIDIGGYDILYDILKAKEPEIIQKGLIFLISAGWIPGLSGIIPIELAKHAELEGMQISELNVYTTGKEKWSYGSCRDMVWSMFENFYGVYVKGKWKKKIPLTGKSVYFYSLKEKQKVMVMFNNQFADFAKEKKYDLFSEYIGSNEFGFRAKILSLYIIFFLKNNKEKAAVMYQKAIEKDHANGKRFGLVQAEACSSEGEKVIAELYTENNYLLTGIAPALAAQQLLNKQLVKQSGVLYMCNAVDTAIYIEQLALMNHEIIYYHE